MFSLLLLQNTLNVIFSYLNKVVKVFNRIAVVSKCGVGDDPILLQCTTSIVVPKI